MKTYLWQMKKAISIICISAILISCSQKQPGSEIQEFLKEPIEGLWKLHLMEIKDSLDQWDEWRGGMQGYLLYDGDGHMALHLTPKGYENTSLKFPNFTDTISLEALKYITNNYNYFGEYEIDYDSSIVTHFKISHSNPSEWYTIAKRGFSFNGDTLIVKPVEEQNARLRLKFLKED